MTGGGEILWIPAIWGVLSDHGILDAKPTLHIYRQYRDTNHFICLYFNRRLLTIF